MIEFEILIKGLFTSKEIKVVYNPTETIPKDEHIKNFIEDQWIAKVDEAEKLGVKIFNGKLFRLSRFQMDGNKLILELSDTDYKNYVGTRVKEFYENHTKDRLSNPLAVCVVIVSSDGKILIERRKKVDVYPGRYHVIGGFFDRETDFGVNSVPNPFNAIKREVLEETGIKLEDTNLYSLGLVYDLVNPHPEMCFYTKLDTSFGRILSEFPTCKLDSEIEKIEFINDSSDNLAKFIILNHGNISSTGEACSLLHGNYKYGDRWYSNIMGLRGCPPIHYQH